MRRQEPPARRCRVLWVEEGYGRGDLALVEELFAPASSTAPRDQLRLLRQLGTVPAPGPPGG